MLATSASKICSIVPSGVKLRPVTKMCSHRGVVTVGEHEPTSKEIRSKEIMQNDDRLHRFTRQGRRASLDRLMWKKKRNDNRLYRFTRQGRGASLDRPMVK